MSNGQFGTTPEDFKPLTTAIMGHYLNLLTAAPNSKHTVLHIMSFLADKRIIPYRIPAHVLTHNGMTEQRHAFFK